MRHFLVLGFETSGRSEMGDPIHLGTDRVAAITEMTKVDEKFKRKEVFELAVPHMTRHFDHSVASKVEPEPGPEPDGDELPEMSDAARALAEEHELTDEQLAEVVPSGAGGKIIKDDMVSFLESLESTD